MEHRRFSPQRLEHQLFQLNVSRRQLGKRLNPDNSESARKALLKHLKGKHDPTPETIQRYADALGISVEDITVEDEESAEVSRLLERLAELRARQASRSAA